MSSQLRYGADSTLELDLDAAALVDCHAPRGKAVADPRAATSAALANPLDFPPLRQAVIPGDHVALAVQGGVPQRAAVVAAMVADLIGAGVAAAHICVVHDASDPAIADDLRRELP